MYSYVTLMIKLSRLYLYPRTLGGREIIVGECTSHSSNIQHSSCRFMVISFKVTLIRLIDGLQKLIVCQINKNGKTSGCMISHGLYGG